MRSLKPNELALSVMEMSGNVHLQERPLPISASLLVEQVPQLEVIPTVLDNYCHIMVLRFEARGLGVGQKDWTEGQEVWIQVPSSAANSPGLSFSICKRGIELDF